MPPHADRVSTVPEVSDLPAPGELSAGEAPIEPLTISPAQQLLFYDPDRWEEFIREWATAVSRQYLQVKRIGGSGDKGADVAGFLTTSGFEGDWDCYQCKHYGAPLGWSDVLPEIVKVFRYAAAGDYVLPRRYAFVAPRGLSSTMSRLISRPTTLKQKFLADAPAKLLALELTPAEQEAILDLAGQDDFSRFSSEELGDVIALHRQTPYFVDRFGSSLPVRTQHGQPPAVVDSSESNYVGHLLDVYEERWGGSFDRAAVGTDPRSQKHFERQRVRFFEAESLRAYARDSVLPGTFEKFQDAILSGIEDVLDADHPNGWTRLTTALTTAGQLNLASHALVVRAEQDDLKGVCHQLANDNRIVWIRP